jgi:hypothetical protein
MPRLGTLYTAMEPRIRRLPRRRPLAVADILKPAFRLERDRRLEISYAPMDWLRPAARVAIVGITPGKGTMVIAYQTAVEGLAAGRSAAAILNEVKSRAAFSGFRRPLITRLEYLGVHRHLGMQSAAELWTPAGERHLHSTSAIRYPTLVDGEDYSGRNPQLTSRPALRSYIRELLAPELAKIPDALVIPLGVGIDAAITLLVDEGRIDPARCLVGFPHPSGRNQSGAPQWEANRSKLKRRVSAWFRAHPAR